MKTTFLAKTLELCEKAQRGSQNSMNCSEVFFFSTIKILSIGTDRF